MDTTLAPQSPTATPTATGGPSVDASFIDRRSAAASVGRERRQFTNSHSELSAEAGELADAIDAYKLRHRRRFINFEEMLTVLKSLGYQK